jgi:hypothetical protein
MVKITARDFQVFVAGGLALKGFSALIGFAHGLAVGADTRETIIWAMIALLLPLGVGILLGSALALRCAQIYLWVAVVCGAVVLAASGLPLGTISLPFVSAYSVAAYAIFLALLLWSKSRRFANASNA